MKIALFLLLIMFSLEVAANEQGNEQCDPVVVLNADSATLKKALTQLANQNNFKLVFPVDADKEIKPRGKMPLSKMLRYLITDLSSIVQVESVTGCKTKRITGIEILVVGKETGYRDINQEMTQPELIVIYDMGAYAVEVLLKQRKARRNLMSIEQKKAFSIAKRAAKKRLIEQGLIKP